jgi:hypothetical protein
MIILEGPDGTGKSTIAHQLESMGMKYFHFTQHSEYKDYIEDLCNLGYTNAVLDRHAISEYPYASVMHRQFRFTMKQWHNIITMTLIQNPIIVLCTHKPLQQDYPADQYMPYSQWDNCLRLYREFFLSHGISYMEYDYTAGGTNIADFLYQRHIENLLQMAWWRAQWQSGYGCAGSPYPKVLLVAERIGPNNMHNIPFETGPTGHMLTDMLVDTKTPLGNIAITNMVKAARRDTRPVNDHDIEMFEEELTHLHPKKVIFMGSIAKRGIKLAKDHGCEVATITHLGAYNHKGITDMSGYHNEWAKLIGLLPSVSYKEPTNGVD